MKYICVLTLTIFLTKSVLAQEKLLLPPGVGALSTRDASEYMLREQALISLLTNKENKDNYLLADNFQTWLANSSQWVSKERWLEMAKQQKNCRISNLSVRYVDDLVVVSFLLEANDNARHQPLTQSVIDIWRKSTNKLNVRYITDVPEKIEFEKRY